MQKTRSRTYESLDLWRGFAAVWVVLFHGVVNINNDTPVYSNLFALFCGWGDTAVPIFFVISGYCMAAAAVNLIERDQTIGRFALARVRRIYPPHLAALAFCLLITILFWIAQQMGAIQANSTAVWFTQITPRLVAVNALLLQVLTGDRSINDVTWTLCYEVAFYAVIALAIFLLRRNGWQRMLKVLHVVTVAAFAVAVFAPRFAVFPFDQWVGFGQGVLLFDLLCGEPWKERTAKGRLFYILVIAAVAALVVVQIDRQNGSAYSWRIFITSLFTVLFYFLRPFDARIKAIKPLSGLFFVGVFSYSLYLIHFALISVLHRLAVKLHIPARLFAVELFAELAICIVAAYIFYRLVESRFISTRAKPSVTPPPFAASIVPERV